MDFKIAAQLGTYISKDYARDFFELLVNYQDISASEAASRLGLHIRTAQDFLDGLAALDILQKEEVYEKKRPYFRYSLKTYRITLDLDLSEIQKTQSETEMTRCIREKANSGANFSLARGGEHIGHVAFWTGGGRNRKEHKISLTVPQGKFLFHLPFPNAEYLSVSEIMRKADLENELIPEILDIVDVLERHDILEVQ
jgi:hypothetical protein